MTKKVDGRAFNEAMQERERRRRLDALGIAWNFVQAKLHRAQPCGRCGYRYDCPDGECHS